MSLRIAQLQEVRTAPAAHEGHRWQEGPVTPSSRRSWLAKAGSGGGGGSLGAEGPSAANVARPNGYALETGDAAYDGWGWPKGGVEHSFAIARLDARLSFENAGKECPAGGPRLGRVAEVPGQTPCLAILPVAAVNASHQGGRASCVDAQASRNAARSHESSALPHSQAHANSSALSKHAPWAGDKGLGRNGIPKPAGAGGGSSCCRWRRTRGQPASTTLKSRHAGGPKVATVRNPLDGLARDPRAKRALVGSHQLRRQRHYRARRKEGKFSTARASDIEDARTALFSAKVSLGSLATSSGWV